MIITLSRTSVAKKNLVDKISKNKSMRTTSHLQSGKKEQNSKTSFLSKKTLQSTSKLIKDDAMRTSSFQISNMPMTCMIMIAYKEHLNSRSRSSAMGNFNDFPIQTPVKLKNCLYSILISVPLIIRSEKTKILHSKENSIVLPIRSWLPILSALNPCGTNYWCLMHSTHMTTAAKNSKIGSL